MNKILDFEKENENKYDNLQRITNAFKGIDNIRKNYEDTDYDDRDIAHFEENNFFLKAEQKVKDRLKKLIAIDLITIMCISIGVFANYIYAFATDTYTDENVQAISAVEFEANNNAIDMENILLENVSILKTKELIEEVRDIEFETQYTEDANLPLGEEIVDQEGENGSEDVTVIKTYENDEMIEENLIDEVITSEPLVQKVRVGTSEFLKNNQIHLGDTIYATNTVAIKDKPDEGSTDIATIPSSIEAVLIEMSGEWCKVKYEDSEGYIQCSALTSATATPTIIEDNRIQKLKLSVSEDMPLNKSSGLKLEDFKKILSNNIYDRNNVFSSTAEDFYKADQEYNINGVFLASIGIHESAWGTSKIAREKKNLFGYGAYDSSPYESAVGFEDYYDGIKVLADALSKKYVNPVGTVLSNGEIATGIYYNGNTVAGVNVRYASDKEWHNKVFKYMKQLYENL